MYEDEMSKDTGLPSWLTRSLDSNVQFVVEDFVDHATAAIAEWDEKQTDKKGKKKRYGVVRYAVPMTATGEPLEYGGLTRQRFREAAIQVEQDLSEGIDIERDRPATGYDPAEYGDGVTDPA